MSNAVDLYNSTYGRFAEDLMAEIRRETFGEDIGQNSWLTVAEFDAFLDRLSLRPSHHVLDVACGSGGPSLYMARTRGCRVTGVDSNESGIATAREASDKEGLNERAYFRAGDANQPLPFPPASFDAIVCIDAINHLADRPATLRDWFRLLKPGGRLLYTDPIIVTGPLSNEEIARRSSIGFFLFVPSGYNERLLEKAGFQPVEVQDATENTSRVSGKWLESRQRHRAGLVTLEGEERFEGLQAFFATVQRLSSERRLSRMAFIAEKPAA
jgi:SAM-dependent methyltransferase